MSPALGIAASLVTEGVLWLCWDETPPPPTRPLPEKLGASPEPTRLAPCALAGDRKGQADQVTTVSRQPGLEGTSQEGALGCFLGRAGLAPGEEGAGPAFKELPDWRRKRPLEAEIREGQGEVALSALLRRREPLASAQLPAPGLPAPADKP